MNKFMIRTLPKMPRETNDLYDDYNEDIDYKQNNDLPTEDYAFEKGYLAV